MPEKLSTLELLDGSHLVFEGPMAPNVARELDAWALVPEGEPDEAARDASIWAGALQAGPLLYVAFTGVVGNAAWAVFPAAARYLRDHLSHAEPALDALAAGTRAQRAAASVFSISEADVTVEEVRRDGEGVWQATLRLSDGRAATVRLDATGLVTHVKLRP